MGKKQLSKIIEKCIKAHGTARTSEVLDAIKAQGYKYSTKGALTVAVCDAAIPPEKKQYIAEAEAKVDEITEYFNMGLMSDDERYRNVIKTWNETTEKVTQALQAGMDPYNPIYMMSDSGARGSIAQLRQLAGMRGLIANTSGRTIEVPIRANYREGLNILEYFISSRGARKGLADTALRTADSGYLTRRLVDVSQDVIIREDDCGTHEGIEVYDIYGDGSNIIEPFAERLSGRYLADDFCDADGNVLVSRDVMMGDKEAKLISDTLGEGNRRIKIRSVLNCRARQGVCARCYGANLATIDPVSIGEAVGIIAAQSIGEPGTQLTMRTFHTGGVASAEDITQGLPRVEELFEGRKPKHLAIISEIGGSIRFGEEKKKRMVYVTDNTDGAIDERAYAIPFGSHICVNEGDVIEKGDRITEGAINPHDILAINGPQAVQDYLIQEVQRTYRMQGVDINDKHVEVIVRQMMRKVKVEEPGSTNLLASSMVDRSEFEAENAAVRARVEAGEEGLSEATCLPTLLGITKAALATDSFLSAASFQETTRVLTEAAIKGKVDPLLGLKENVIIGKLVPAGTGMQRYNEVKPVSTKAPAEEEPYIEALRSLLAEEDAPVAVTDEDVDVELLDEADEVEVTDEAADPVEM